MGGTQSCSIAERTCNGGRSFSVPGSRGTTAAREQRNHSGRGLDTAGLLRAQIREVHRELDEGLVGWLRSLAPAAPPTGSRVVPLYVHAATVEDLTIHSLLRQVAPLYETDWAGKGPAAYSTADVVPLRAYAHQVFAATDAYLAGLAPDQLIQTVDLRRLGLGQPTTAWIVSKFVVLELAQIYGELTSAVEEAGRAAPTRSRITLLAGAPQRARVHRE
jgi:hypothetical protein